MKKTIILLAALYAAQLAMAKDYVLVVKGNNNSVKSNIEVKSDNDGIGETETIAVNYGSDVTSITVSVKDIYGAVLFLDVIPMTNGTYILTIPDYPNGIIIEVKDEKGCVCSFYNN